MKQIKYLFVFVAIVIPGLTACKKESSNNLIPDQTAAEATLIKSPTAATVVRSVIDIDVSTWGPTFVPISCIEGGVGEFLLLEGTLRITSFVTKNENHFTSKLQFHPDGIIGIGQTTGDTYKSVGGEEITTTGSFVNGQNTSSVIDRFYWIGRGGDAAKFFFNITMHITTNADGTVTASIDKTEASCK